ncbi:peptidase domain-containing ABC transporter [Stigmatella sp. ncwal1]|uniref:Peptidase domain-containing ABC transporter n=1 Tax=Stigmatella ashevillensis TaxID=2995309 RepID=A0ABT5DMP6_9BACT|nr:peptidase domain-containing ABC transporter [Stigmatella ashevillena]MDC0714929.1 peptidase domain-containing ABC transporter [Stigmatella ashevillena]
MKTDESPQPSPLTHRFPALQNLQARSRGRRIPIVHQLSETECGAACLAMAMGFHGRPTRLEQVRQTMGAARDGVSALDILRAARAFGLRGRGVSIDPEALRYLPTGTILHWQFSHFVVFERLGRDCVHVVDPGHGRRRVPMERFRQSFTGVALLLEPGEHFETRKAQPRNASRYALQVIQQSHSLGRILTVSLVLQLFALAVPALTGLIIDRVVPRGDQHLLLVVGLGLLSLAGFQLLTSLIRGHLLLELRTRMDSSMTLSFLEHLVSLSYSFFQVRAAGDLLARLNSNSTVREILSSSAISGVLDGVLVVLYLVLLVAVSPLMALLVLGLSLLQILILLLSTHRQRALLSENLEVEAKSQSYQIEMLTGIQTLKAFGVEHQAVQRFSELLVNVLNVSLKRGQLAAWVDALTGTLRMASPLILLTFGALQVLAGKMTLGTMMGLNALAGALLVPLANLVTTGTQLQLLRSYIERIDDVLDTPPERAPDQMGRPIKLRGGIELDNVAFRYSPLAPLVVQDVSVRIAPGQFVAIVGRSGAGKSTLARLLLGLYLPSTGRVLFDAQDLTELDLHSVRNQLGVVPQEPAFFSSTLRANIALADPNTPLESITEAAQLAQLHEDILAMPMGYDTPLVDQGASLSGGQRQRLALARALMQKPAVLLLDEATSALDAITERKVQQSLAGLSCTRIVIAHRLSTVVEADLILVMDEGHLVESGSHEELLARGGVYSRLVNAQVRKTGRLE